MTFDLARRRLERFCVELQGCRVPVRDSTCDKSKFVDIGASGNGDEANCFDKCSCGSVRMGKVGER